MFIRLSTFLELFALGRTGRLIRCEEAIGIVFDDRSQEIGVFMARTGRVQAKGVRVRMDCIGNWNNGNKSGLIIIFTGVLSMACHWVFSFSLM
jgi:hypothetical protein